MVCGHGIGLSLPSAIPLDIPEVDQIAGLAEDLEFQWYSEHLSMFLVPKGSVPNSQAGLGLPVPYDEETFDILKDKLNTLRQAIYVNPVLAALPGVMIFITSICFNLMSDGLRAAMDVKA